MKPPPTPGLRRQVVPAVGRVRVVARHRDTELDHALLDLHAAQEMQEFWRATRHVLHSTLPLHYVCLCIRPFVLMPTTVFRERAPFASEAEFKRFQELSPLRPCLVAHPGTLFVRMSDIVPDHELVRTEFYRLFMRPHDDRYFACFNFWNAGAFQGMIGLHRTSAQHDFTRSEVKVLFGLHAHFDTVLHRILNLHRERAVRLSLEKLVVNLPIATVLLDWDLRVTYRNRLAIEHCAAWNLGPERARMVKYAEDFRLPDAILAHCTEFKTHWTPGNRLCPLTTPGGAWIASEKAPGLRATVNFLQLDAAPLSMPMFLVRLEYSVTEPHGGHGGGNGNGNGGGYEENHGHGVGLPQFARLSAREREVAALVGQGCSNDEVAHQLGKSVLTVKKQLRSIYEKLEVHNRGRLIALLR